MIKCPPISAALLEYLKETFPDHAVDPKHEDAAQHYGSVLVIRHLLAQKQTQEEDHHVSLET